MRGKKKMEKTAADVEAFAVETTVPGMSLTPEGITEFVPEPTLQGVSEESPAAPKKRRGRKPKAVVEKKPSAEYKTETVGVAAPNVAAAAPSVKKRVGRRPLTEAEKTEAAIKRAEEKAKAEKMSPVLFLQYQGNEVDTAVLIDAVKADFKSRRKRTLLTDLKLYLKPEEHMVYYVANGFVNGSIQY